MSFSSLRCVLSKSYFPTAFLVGITLLILDATAPPVVAQVRTVTVTVYVTLVRTLPVEVPIYVTVASMATSFITFTSTAVSISLGTVTLWNTVTAVTTAVGIFGSMPSTVFGAFSDLAIMGGGITAGAVITLASVRLLSQSRLPHEEGSPPPTPPGSAAEAAGLSRHNLDLAGRQQDDTPPADANDEPPQGKGKDDLA